ncbi:MAG: glycosyltransferase family 2 protein [Planctomycetaceae bacterium]
MTLTVVAAIAVLLAALPAILFVVNLAEFAPPAWSPPWPESSAARPQQVSLLIPARNEVRSIEGVIASALQSENVELEVLVLDDHSEDETAEIVQRMAEKDTRVRLIHGAPLPAGWNGKQHACYQLANESQFARLAFIDADVRLRPDALVRLITHQEATGVGLLSAFPHQITGTWLEKWMIPLMHFILLGFLPVRRMRRSVDPAYAAGCGQLFVTRKDSYHQAGTHAAIRASRHDGLKLPRAYRIAGLSTDVVDGTSIASCRMYRSAGEVVQGLLKNASEGIANPKLIVPFSIILLGGGVVPWATLPLSMIDPQPLSWVLSLMAIVLSHLPRAIAAGRFQQSWQGVLFHAPALVLFVLLQWLALFNYLRGHQTRWRGRV